MDKAIWFEVRIRRDRLPYTPQKLNGGVYFSIGTPYPPQQSYQQQNPHKFKPKGKQFNKKYQSSSSSSIGSRSISGMQYSGIFCYYCGGRHFSAQYSGVQGYVTIAISQGNYARVCLRPAQRQVQPQQLPYSEGGFREIILIDPLLLLSDISSRVTNRSRVIFHCHFRVSSRLECMLW